MDVDRLITESSQLWQHWETELKNAKECVGGHLEPQRRLRFWKTASLTETENKLYLSDIERFLKIIRTEKWLGQAGVESLQKMALALLETIESKSTLLETMTKTNKTLGSRLRCLVRSSSGDVDGEEEEAEHQLTQQSQQQHHAEGVELITPPEIDFEQPNRQQHGAEETIISIVKNVHSKRNRRC